MIDISVLDDEIAALEDEETTYETCEQLAWLYVVRDHVGAREDPETVPDVPGTEFLEVVSGRDVRGVMRVLAEHMEAIRVVAPKEYERVIERIRAI